MTMLKYFLNVRRPHAIHSVQSDSGLCRAARVCCFRGSGATAGVAGWLH